jgi:hypothetical protein
VGPFNSTLTPVGEVMQLFSHHTGATLLDVPNEAIAGDLDTTATISKDGATLIATIASLSAVGWASTDVTVALGTDWSGATGTVTALTAQDYKEDALFDKSTGPAHVSPAGELAISIPPFSVVQVALSKK